MRRMDWYLTAWLALYAAGIQLVLSQMILLLHTLVIMRPILGGALPMSVFWDAYLGALPNVFYLTLPLSVAFALVFGYAHFVRERAFTVLFAAGISNWRLAMPGLAVAACAAILGAAVAHIWAPRGADRLEDAKHYVRVELPHRLLPENQFVDLVPARLTLYFKEWLDVDLASQISLYDRRDDGEHRIIDAKLGRFVREGRTLSIVFQTGNLHTFDLASGEARSVAFREFATGYVLGADPELAKRPEHDFYVRSTAWLYAPPREIRAQTVWYRHSQAELHKRLATPLFVLCYASLIVGCVFFMERTGRGLSVFLFVLPLALSCAHIGLIVLFEIGVRSGAGVATFAYALLIAAAAAGAVLIQLHDSGHAPRLSRRLKARAGRWRPDLARWYGEMPKRLRSATLQTRLLVARVAKHSQNRT